MRKTLLTVDGMVCGMCEAHINDAIRRAFSVKKVTASHTKGQVEIISETLLDEERLRCVIGDTGYTLTAVNAAPYEKKGFHLFGKK